MHSRRLRARTLRSLSLTLVLGGLAALGSLGQACTTASNPEGGGTDGGGSDTGPGSQDGSAIQGDGSNTPVDGASSGDAGDAAPIVCPNHLPAGFTQIVAAQTVTAVLTGESTARAQAMVLDENDDPMFAYASMDSGTSWSINFVRWDACAGKLTTPLLVHTVHPFGGPPDVSLAYDATTKEVGIAFENGATDNNWADSYGEINLATMKSPATTFTAQRLSIGSDDYTHAGGPSIAMGGGHVYIAFWQGPYPSNDTDYAGLVWLLSSTSTATEPPVNAPASAPDGSVGDAAPAPEDASTEDAGPAPPHYFAYDAVPYVNGTSSAANGFVFPNEGSGAISVGIDSNGVAGVAMYQDSNDYGHELLFWRANTASAAHVYSFSLDDSVDLSLAFEGTKPRIAGHMDVPVEADAATAAPDGLKFFESPDGVTWSGGINLPNNDSSQNTAFTSALALDGLGHAAVASDINGGVGNGMACGANPYVATSSDEDDGGANWIACGADTASAHGYGGYSVSAAYGQGRSKGTLTLSFVTNDSTVTDAGADLAGLIFWQHP